MMGTVVTTGMTDEGEYTRIPIVSLQVVTDRYVEYLREDLTTSRKAAEWVERNIIRHSNREHLVVVCCDKDYPVPQPSQRKPFAIQGR